MTEHGASGAIARSSVDAARARWERALDELRQLTDPSHPLYENFFPGAPWVLREKAKREQVVQFARIEYDELEARFAAQEARARVAREEELLRRRVAAEEQAAKHAAIQATIARRHGHGSVTTETRGRSMNEMLQNVQRKEADRLAVLQAIYEMTDGNTHAAVAMNDVYEKLALTPERGRAAIEYLSREGLVLGKTSHRVAITHAGVVEVEQAVRAPTRPTTHFSPVVINQVFNAAVGAVQTGADAVANVQQNLAPVEQREAALAELDAAAEKVEDPAKRDQAVELARAVREEMQKPAPSATRVAAYVSLMTALVSAAPTVEHVIKMLFGG